MKKKKLAISFYDTYVGDYDQYNPRYVAKKPGVPEILYLIASHPPYTLSKPHIGQHLRNLTIGQLTEALDSLRKIEAISLQDNCYKLTFPVFIERDVDLLGDFNQSIGQQLGDLIIAIQAQIDAKISQMSCAATHDLATLRYHVIGCETLDGGTMDYLAEKGIMTTSKVQPGGRDYLMLGYEECAKTFKFSNQLLCSCNLYTAGKFGFCSFGDANGQRKDMFRFVRRVQTRLESATEHHSLNTAYLKLHESSNQVQGTKCGELLLKALRGNLTFQKLSKGEQAQANFLLELGYLSYEEESGAICPAVPIFTAKDRELIQEVSTLITLQIFEAVQEIIETLDQQIPDLTALQHGVEFADIANELWHLMFGAINEYLIDQGFFATPEYRDGEGRYLQCVYLS